MIDVAVVSGREKCSNVPGSEMKATGEAIGASFAGTRDNIQMIGKHLLTTPSRHFVSSTLLNRYFNPSKPFRIVSCAYDGRPEVPI